MSREETEEEKKGITEGLSRRQFLKDAGLLVGGAAVGSAGLASACSKPATGTTSSPPIITTVTKPLTAPVTTTVTSPPSATTVEGLTTLIVNGRTTVMQLRGGWSLAYVLREKLGFTGTKIGCANGWCGSCTVIMDGRPVLSCMTLAVEADKKPVTTVEGLAGVNTLDSLQQAFIDNDAMQCGFCTAGQLMTAKALLTFKPKPTQDEVREFMAGALCRCGAHPAIQAAIQQAANAPPLITTTPPGGTAAPPPTTAIHPTGVFD